MEHELPENIKIITDLRRRFLAKGDFLNDFNEKDVDRVRDDDFYLWLFLKHKQNEIDKALDMLVECLRWRESFGINDLAERNIDRRLFEIGFLYPRNHDKNRNPLLLFHTRLYKKEVHNINEVKKFLAFGLEKLAQQYPGRKVTLIFDMQDSGLANMDLVLIKFVITCFQTYYPCMLEYMIVFETPWILTAAWKIVKTWLSTEGISKIKFVNKTEILQFIDSDQLLTSMGGCDDFVYSYPPQLFTSKLQPPLENSLKAVNSEGVLSSLRNPSDVEFSSISVSADHANQKKGSTMKPSDEFMVVKQNGDMVSSSIEFSLTDSIQPKQARAVDNLAVQQKPARKKDARTKKSQLEHIGPLVTICPANELIFCGQTTTGVEILQILTITNTVSSTVAFKVKTTSPENYRVRPSSGSISPGAAMEVHIFLQPGHATGVVKDKFLVLSTVLPEQEKGDFATMWKSIPKSSIMEHRLRCRFELTSSQISYPETAEEPSQREVVLDPLQVLSNNFIELNNKIDRIQKKISALERDAKAVFHVAIAILVIFMLLIVACLLYAFCSYYIPGYFR